MSATDNQLAAPRRASAEEMPILDLSDWIAGGSIEPLAREFDAACTNTGFFYVKNHGVPQAVVDGVFDATRRYFDLPLEERLKDKIDERFRRGFMPYGVTQHPGFKPDLKESYEVGMDLPLTDPDVQSGLPLHGPNKWPADKPWLKEAAEAYFQQTLVLGKRLLRLFATALGQPEDFFLQYTQKPMVQSRLFHYPPQSSPSQLELGAAAHSDYGMITILAQDPIGGLELRTRGGEWVAAPYVDGTLVINLGDMVKVWTNEHYVSNLHRVANRTGRERYSIPTFFNLDYHTPVRCLPGFCSADEPPRHAPIKSGDYLVKRFSEVQSYKTPAQLAEA
ncbi:isopenicillin N synthase family oxygenase [Ramlibacter sp. AW1]|uniref:Isopenicillin N synthase family oxygenase n=1 Tax=Ramlibacter aurantiacus TaxID=2801330 RepID=A0A936ZY73_9BURK|nr:isopenicillin N synthase family oxygenase [Ramlibacter aurantiacus]MBL0422654.1 isopenicillin N synthase family oxygenase [Ramlibacter aurantiacus]